MIAWRYTRGWTRRGAKRDMVKKECFKCALISTAHFQAAVLSVARMRTALSSRYALWSLWTCHVHFEFFCFVTVVTSFCWFIFLSKYNKFAELFFQLWCFPTSSLVIVSNLYSFLLSYPDVCETFCTEYLKPKQGIKQAGPTKRFKTWWSYLTLSSFIWVLLLCLFCQLQLVVHNMLSYKSVVKFHRSCSVNFFSSWTYYLFSSTAAALHVVTLSTLTCMHPFRFYENHAWKMAFLWRFMCQSRISSSWTPQCPELCFGVL